MRLLAAIFFFIFFSTFSTAIAQSDTDEFTISFFAGTDTEPPTPPVLLSATAISETQVDLAWSTSTDNFVMSGYVVSRDGVSLATTTLITYSDIGLTASTTYAYDVRAFDFSGNYSSSSNTIIVSTPDYPAGPPPPVPIEPSEGTVARVVAEEVVVTPDITSATFDITAKFPARFEIKWGRTTSYELGYISSDILRRDYSTILTGLEPGTKYEYEIIGYTQRGNGNVVERGQFRTLNDIDLTAPANVKRFTAVPEGGNVNLNWQLPDDDDISSVRIVRSHLGYPANPNDGAVIYQGTGNNAVDIAVLFRYSPAYYTAFVYDTAGNISSGAIAIAFAGSRETTSEGDRNEDVGFVLEPLSSTTQRMPDAFDILIKQANRVFSFGEESAVLDNDEPFVIYLDASDVTSNLKSIIVQLQDPTDQRQSFSFLLQLNKNQTAYEAIISPLGVVGKSSIVLSVYDFRALRVAEYRTQLFFEDLYTAPTIDDLQFGDSRLLWQFLLFVLLLLGIVIWWLVTNDRDEDKEDDAEPENTV